MVVSFKRTASRVRRKPNGRGRARRKPGDATRNARGRAARRMAHPCPVARAPRTDAASGAVGRTRGGGKTYGESSGTRFGQVPQPQGLRCGVGRAGRRLRGLLAAGLFAGRRRRRGGRRRPDGRRGTVDCRRMLGQLRRPLREPRPHEGWRGRASGKRHVARGQLGLAADARLSARALPAAALLRRRPPEVPHEAQGLAARRRRELERGTARQGRMGAHRTRPSRSSHRRRSASTASSAPAPCTPAAATASTSASRSWAATSAAATRRLRARMPST